MRNEILEHAVIIAAESWTQVERLPGSADADENTKENGWRP
jgi:hypothetical protein